jgi:molybdate transport system ATP-binding protein
MLSVNITSNNLSPTPLTLAVEIPLDNGIVGIMGPSGCGKTTLLRILAGLESRYNSQLKLLDKTLCDESISIKPDQRNIGLVFQDARLFSHLTVEGNLKFALKRAKQPKFTLEQVATWFGLKDKLTMEVDTLSGGQKQRVAVARAIIHSPDLLLLDEPFVSLDMASRTVLLRCLEDVYQQTSIPIIFVSHDINDIRQLCQQLLLMDHGKIVQQGETFHLLNQLDTGLKLAYPIAATLRCAAVENVSAQPISLLLLTKQKLIVSQVVEQVSGCVINAADVSISLVPVPDCSIANCVQTTVTTIRELDPQNVVVELALDGQILYAQISGYSLQRLALQPGMTVYALFKASALRII